MDGLPKEWHNLIPTPVKTEGPCMILYDQQIHTDITVAANKPDIILRHNTEKWCKQIEVSVPVEKNIRQPKKQTKGRNSQDVRNENRNYSGHSGSSTGSHDATFNKRKFKENFEEFERRNHPGNRTTWDGPHSSENPKNSTIEIRAFIPKELSRDLE